MGCKTNIPRKSQCSSSLNYCKLVFLGLNNSGKTAILNQLSSKTTPELPSMGVSPTTLIYNQKCRIVVLDVPGSISQQWPLYTDKAQAIVFVIDCSDIKRINKAKEQLHRADKLVTDSLFLVYLNKQDKMQQHHEDTNWVDILDINNLKNEVIVEKSSTKNGLGVKQGLKKLMTILQQKQSQTNSSRSHN